MSASPPKPVSAASSVTPTSGGPPVIRKKPPVSIFTQKKKPVKRTIPNARTSAPSQAPNATQQQPSRPVANGVTAASAAAQPEAKGYQEYPILVSKNALMQGLHYHAMKLQGRPVNPYDENQFTRPAHLHRRNARDKMETAEQSDAASGVDDKERELNSIRRAERQAEREANQLLIAPTGGDTKKTVRKKPQKKVEDVYYDENDPKQRQRQQLRYEEARPWHLEDFDSKNVWIGSYEEPMSEASVMFEIDQDGFVMFPVEKWYKFQQTGKSNAMDSDAVEKYMSQKHKPQRWFLGTQEANDQARRQAALARREQMQAQRRAAADDDDAPSFMQQRDEYQADVDEIDFEFNDEFQDDDEGFVFGVEENEESKEIERRIREEMRSANLAGTGVKDEDKDWDEEEAKEKEKEHDEKRRAKKIKKQLIKKENRKTEYESDSDRGEFSESSDTEDSEEERERLEEEKKQEEARKVSADKSGASTRGTNTPSGRSEKKDGPRSLSSSLKRPGSPDLSELSGNESSRKKAKGINGGALSRNAPNGARSLSPDAAKVKRTNTGGGYGSGSDTDTSRTGRPKINVKRSPPGSPHTKSPSGSRAGSPSGTGSRAQSPSRQAQPFPTLEEVREAIPPGGIGISELVKLFRPRVLQRQPDFIALVKQAGKQDPTSKKILPKVEV